METKNKALCALGKTQKNRPSDSQMFSGKDFYESKFLHLLIPAAAAAAKSLQSCLTLCDPVDGSPPGSPVPGIL